MTKALQLRRQADILWNVRGAGSGYIVARILGACAAVWVVAAPPPVQGPRYSPPALPNVAANQLDILGVEIQQNNLADAVRRLDSLLHDTPDAMIAASDGGGTITLGTWIDLLPAQQRQLPVKGYYTQFWEAAARDA